MVAQGLAQSLRTPGVRFALGWVNKQLFTPPGLHSSAAFAAEPPPSSEDVDTPSTASSSHLRVTATGEPLNSVRDFWRSAYGVSFSEPVSARRALQFVMGTAHR